MRIIRWPGAAVLLVASLLALAGVPAVQGQAAAYEVWIIDQADAARGGARLYIFDGARLAAGQLGAPEVINLDAAAAGVGDGPGVRPHMLAFDPTYRYAVIANVASGHVYVMRASDRKIIASIDVGEQAHHAEVSPDGRFIIAANQNGKRLARIAADFAAERFTYSRADDLDLGALQDGAHPDNAPICPVLAGNRAYVTLRGGGLYVVGYATTPMRVLRSYGVEQILPAGCGGVVTGGKVYINSGTATSSSLYVFDEATDALRKSLRLSWTGADGHGMVLVGGGRYLWMGNRADGNIAVISTSVDALAGLITGVGAAPDIMGASPDGRFVFVAMRGPNNLTGGPPAKGDRPGLLVLQVLEDGRNARRVTFVPIGDQTAGSANDTHVVAVRPLGR
jgi:DNA-binding beta-propeller fold protein YncE